MGYRKRGRCSELSPRAVMMVAIATMLKISCQHYNHVMVESFSYQSSTRNIFARCHRSSLLATNNELQDIHTHHVPRLASSDTRIDANLDRRSLLRASALWGSTAILLDWSLPPRAVASMSPVAPKQASANIPEWILENGIIPSSAAGEGASSGVAFPTLALNTVGLSVEDTTRAVAIAHRAGITHVDFHPGKERDGVAAYLRQQGQRQNAKNNIPPATKLFLNTKIRKAPPGTSPTEAAERTRSQIKEDLAALGVDQVDMLMLRDSPDCDVIQAQWAVLEDALRQGQTRSIGVINFCQSALQCVLRTATIRPALNYYMLHVGMGKDPRGLRSFGESKGIRTFAYGAVGEPGPNTELLSSPILKSIGANHGNKSPEEVALRWVLQSGAAVSVRPTLNFDLGVSSCSNDMDGLKKCQEGIASRADAFEWMLTSEEMETLSQLTSPNDNPTLFSSAGCPDAYVMPPAPKR